jgi:predicted RecA/RadA family phage recombinase
MKNFVQDGDVLTLVAPYDVLAGHGVIVGGIFGFASYDAKSGAEVEVNTEGVYDAIKVSAQAWSVGDTIYWDDSAKNCTTTSSGNTAIGVAILAAANPSDTGRVRLNGTFT